MGIYFRKSRKASSLPASLVPSRWGFNIQVAALNPLDDGWMITSKYWLDVSIAFCHIYCWPIISTCKHLDDPWIFLAVAINQMSYAITRRYFTTPVECSFRAASMVKIWQCWNSILGHGHILFFDKLGATRIFLVGWCWMSPKVALESHKTSCHFQPLSKALALGAFGVTLLPEGVPLLSASAKPWTLRKPHLPQKMYSNEQYCYIKMCNSNTPYT